MTTCDDAHDGSFNYAIFEKENAFKTGVTTSRQFGITQSVSPSESNNQRTIAGLGSRNWITTVEGRFDAGVSVNYVLADGRALEFAWGVITYGGQGDGTSTFVPPDEDTRVVAGCDVLAGSALNDMTIAAGGLYYNQGTLYPTTAVSSITVGAAPTTAGESRYDVVSIKDNTGTTVAAVTAGTAAASPVPDWANVPTDECVVAVIHVDTNVTVIANSDIGNLYTISESNDSHFPDTSGDYLVDGGVVTANSTPDEFVDVAAGCGVFAGTGPTTWSAAANQGAFTNEDGSNPRYDLVSIDNAGVVTITAGVAGANPAIPSTPAGDLLLAVVLMGTSGAAPNITDSMIYMVAQRSNSRLSSLTIDVGDAAINHVRGYLGCKCNNLSLNFAKEAEANVSADFTAATVDASRSLVLFTPVTDAPYLHFEGEIYQGANEIALVDSASLSIGNNLEVGHPVTRSSSPRRSASYIIEKGRAYTTSLTVDFTSADQYELFLGATSATTPQDTIASFTMQYRFLKDFINRMNFTLSTVSFDSVTIQPSANELLKQSLTPLVKSVIVDCWDSTNAYPAGNPVV